MWGQADYNQMVLQPITQYGRNIKDEGLTIDEWNTEENLAAIRERVHLLIRGCKCASGCSTNRCGCMKREHQCSPGCECINCTNLSQSEYSMRNSSDADVSILCLEEETEYEEVENIMYFVFGAEK